MNQYLSLLKNNKNYRYLWLGQVVSLLGDWLNLIASAALVARLTNTGAALSYLFLVRFLPLFLFSPIAGVLADRYERRQIMILSDVFRGLIVLCFLFVRDADQLWLLYVLTVGQFALSALFTPARSAVLGNVVARDDLVTANALDSTTWSTMLAFGAAIGAWVAGIFGLQTAFILDGLTYLLSAFFISQVRLDASSNVFGKVARSGWLDFVDGLRYLWGQPYIFVISLVKAGGSLIWGAINVLEVSFAEEIFPINGNGTLTLGILLTITGFGTGFGPLILRRIFGDEPRRIQSGITLAFFLVTAGIFSATYTQNVTQLGIATFVRTLGAGTMWVFTGSLLQTMLPNEVRGRVFSFEFAALTLTQSLSIVWAGYAQDNLGFSIRGTNATMAWVGVGVTVIWLFFQLRIAINRRMVTA